MFSETCSCGAPAVAFGMCIWLLVAMISLVLMLGLIAVMVMGGN